MIIPRSLLLLPFLITAGHALAQQHDIMFMTNLQHRPTGTFSATDFLKDWGDGSGNRIEKMRVKADSSGNKYLEVDYPFRDRNGSFGSVHNYTSISNGAYKFNGTSRDDGTGPATGGVQFSIPIGGTHNELYLSYRFYVPSTFHTAGGKLPGLVGGTVPTGGDSTDKLKGTTVVNGSWDDPGDGTTDGFTGRYMFEAGLDFIPFVYSYNANHIINPKLVDGVLKTLYGNKFSSVEGTTLSRVKANKGAWNSIVQRVVMNDLGKSNGLVEVWLNGKLVIQKSGVVFRKGSKVNFGIDKIYFSTFLGGGDSVCPEKPSSSNPCYNPATGSVYRYTDRSPMLVYAPRKNEYLRFDDIVAFKYKDGVTGVPRGSTKSSSTWVPKVPSITGHLLVK
jgi:hypothetical protein